MTQKASRTKQLQSWDKKYIWHPFTQHDEWMSRDPLIIQSARGVWLRDSQGRRLLDGVSSLWVNVFGHRRPELDAAVRAQLSRMAHSTFLGLSHEPAICLAKELISWFPAPLTRVFYSDNGSTAVEVALKMAYQYQQLVGHPKKSKFVSMKDGYHGDTLGAVSVGGIDLFHQRFGGLLFSGFQVSPGNVKEIEQVLKKQGHQIAAVVMEPLIQGASGMHLMPKGYVRQVADLCRRHGVLLIIDEVATGFGRTGTMFAFEQEGIVPDFVCVAKSLTGGYLPLAATVTSEKIYQAFLGRYDAFKAFFHGHTYTANPLACAAGLATLKLYRKTGLLRHVRARAKEMRQALDPFLNHPHIQAVRQIGLMAGIELVEAHGRSYAPSLRMGLRVCDEAIAQGVWLRPLGDVIVLMPPLSISAKELAFMMKVLRRAIDRATTQRLR